MSVTSTDTWLMLAPLSVAADAVAPAPVSRASAPISSRRVSAPRSKRVTRSAMTGSTIPPRSEAQGPKSGVVYAPGEGAMTARMRRQWAAAAVVAAAYAGQGVFSQKAPAAPAPVTAAQYERWKTELSNWGRWGKDDQIGTLNLITPEKRRQAAALVRDGVSVSLASDADTEKAVDNPTP